MIHSPFSAPIRFACTAIGSVTSDALLEQERASLSKSAVAKRVLEFSAGRVAAREALQAAGLQKEYALVSAPDRSPLWPRGFVGSISHSEKWAVACAAKTKEVQAVGIDLEYLSQASNISILPRVATEREKEWIMRDGVENYQRTIMLFSAKESIYKMLYPLVQKFFGYHAVELQHSEAASQFSVRVCDAILEDFSDGDLTVKVDFFSDYILTSCFIAR